MNNYDDYELFDEEDTNSEKSFDLEGDPAFEQFFLDEILGW